MSTTTARDAERVPDAFGVHRVTTFRQASRVAADRASGFSVFTRSAPGLARVVSPWLWPVHVMSAVGMKPTFGFSDMARPRRRVCVTNDRS